MSNNKKMDPIELAQEISKFAFLLAVAYDGTSEIDMSLNSEGLLIFTHQLVGYRDKIAPVPSHPPDSGTMTKS